MSQSVVDFTNNPDAVAQHPDGGWWFFKDEYCVKTDSEASASPTGIIKISSDKAWPALIGTDFAKKSTAVARHSDGGWWFFSGELCAKTDSDGTKLLYPTAQISRRWPVLGQLSDLG